MSFFILFHFQCRINAAQRWKTKRRTPNDKLSCVNWLFSPAAPLSLCLTVCVWLCFCPTGSVCSVIQVMQSREWTAEQTRGDHSPSIFSLSPALIRLVPVVSVYWSMTGPTLCCVSQQGRGDNLVTRDPEGGREPGSEKQSLFQSFLFTCCSFIFMVGFYEMKPSGHSQYCKQNDQFKCFFDTWSSQK